MNIFDKQIQSNTEKKGIHNFWDEKNNLNF